MKNKVLTFKEGYQVFIDGFQQMIEAILILIFAWCIGGVTSDVGAADYIVEATRGFMTPGIMFISLFITACITSLQRVPVGVLFAIFLPIAIPLALANDVSIYPAIGASLAGSLFGDHCSPISDSTILASLGASCDHLAHVRNAAAVCGVSGFSFDCWICHSGNHYERLYIAGGKHRLHGAVPLHHEPCGQRGDIRKARRQYSDYSCNGHLKMVSFLYN